MVRTVKNRQESCVLIGAGFSARALIPHLLARGMSVYATSRSAQGLTELKALGAIPVPYVCGDAGELKRVLKSATHIISSIGPDENGDPVLRDFGGDFGGDFLSHAPKLEWAGYLSATSVYGDRGGQWVFEDELLRPLTQRGKYRVEAELQWMESGAPVHVFRLAGIYGSGRSPFSKILSGKARAVIKPGHVVNRIHVEDIASAVLASMDAPNPIRAYNIADNAPAPPQDVLTYAADLLGAQRPPKLDHATADISDMARSFYKETKRVNTDRAKTELGWSAKYPTYREGLKATLLAENIQPAGLTIAGYIEVPGADLKTVQAALPDHIRLTQDEPGCLNFSVTQDADNPRRYHVYERFESRAAFAAHQARLMLTPWGKASKNVVRNYEFFGET